MPRATRFSGNSFLRGAHFRRPRRVRREPAHREGQKPKNKFAHGCNRYRSFALTNVQLGQKKRSIGKVWISYQCLIEAGSDFSNVQIHQVSYGQLRLNLGLQEKHFRLGR